MALEPEASEIGVHRPTEHSCARGHVGLAVDIAPERRLLEDLAGLDGAHEALGKSAVCALDDPTAGTRAIQLGARPSHLNREAVGLFHYRRMCSKHLALLPSPLLSAGASLGLTGFRKKSFR